MEIRFPKYGDSNYHYFYDKCRRYPEFKKKCEELGFTGFYKQFWDESSVILSASSFNKVSEWIKAESGAYAFARRKGFLEKAVAHMDQANRGILTELEILEDARKYQTRKEWGKKGLYKAAAAQREKMFYALCCAHFIDLRPRRSDEILISSARKYKTKGEWAQGAPLEYGVASRRGDSIMDAATAHMITAHRMNDIRLMREIKVRCANAGRQLNRCTPEEAKLARAAARLCLYDDDFKNYYFALKRNHSRKIRLIEENRIFSSISDASLYISQKDNVSNIIRSIKNGATCGGFHWEYVD